ncbi:unnamed protein product (macronuclear) [Paramecium tetraurelia]|uniref:Histidine kinase/HSP90-like ATPase domain-containing protein n=1 Tax=Paramecium tetraurelia TaxID=5888 RepID=A0DMV2_PARTE|nr:uncharacterized protein GSPATT00018573001 [Paramecium tetraurelia]CAK84369.1 unnamed protein product [Paramecium tetraurelia]|eukprot:XP_001451766.1 hypothetical protein (macronuclear) [Paramecium tetraurelia strain d4-2]
MKKGLIRLSSNYLLRQSKLFSTNNRLVFRFCSAKQEKHEFKAETKKLLDIVAKSIYTDKDVFLRELLSNASDALEKQRFLATQKGEQVPSDLEIKIDLDEQKRTITIEDSGIGMTKQEMIDNLGTIARSGSKQFLEQVGSQMNDKIIGQFGVGFYSSFIVGDTVEVVSKSERSDKTYVWVSDGTGTFEISEAKDYFQGRGTKITIHLRPDQAIFSKKAEVLKTIQRYSNFINYPIVVNGERQNIVSAIWVRNKNEITPEDYNKFYEYISNSKLAYKYKLHYSTDAPLSIKALLYIPQTHMEKYGMQMEEFDISLYCKKILIRKNCRELLPHFLRFVKGVVDCEDLPLNISREGYQDTALIAKLKSKLNQRLSEIRQVTLLEGVAMDDEHRNSMTKLLRFQTNKSEDFISLDDYISKLPQGINNIYYYLAPTRQQALTSPYMEPFSNSEIPVILTMNHMDEVVFKQINEYSSKKFVNIESDQAEVDKVAQKSTEENEKKEETNVETTIPNDEITPFCLWLKNELNPIISQVQISKRLKTSPAIIVSAISSGMRQVMHAMGQSTDDLKNLTLEINVQNPIIVNLNKVRKSNRVIASLASKQILDGCLLSSGLLRDPKEVVERQHKILNVLLTSEINTPIIEEVGAYREEAVKQKDSKKDDLDTEIIIDSDGNPQVVKKNKK